MFDKTKENITKLKNAVNAVRGVGTKAKAGAAKMKEVTGKHTDLHMYVLVDESEAAWDWLDANDIVQYKQLPMKGGRYGFAICFPDKQSAQDARSEAGNLFNLNNLTKLSAHSKPFGKNK